ncbi:hypothetical protein TNCV_2849681 [Trichonephila clavipes]|nr:hypothetical protein TNCV_2849681 [Trichonephila clavipes]
MKVYAQGEEEMVLIEQRIHQLTFRNTSYTVRDIRSWLSSGPGECLFIETISNRLHEVQLRARVPAAGVPLTAQYRVRRLARCHHHRTWNIEWYQVLFIGESRFCLWRYDGRRRIWRRLGERYE